MIKVIFQNKELLVEDGTRAIDLIDDSLKTNYLICEINDLVKELDRPLINNAKVELFGLEHLEGGKAYETTLRYIVAMAFHNLYPELTIRFSYNVSRSIFCEIQGLNHHISQITENISKEVDRIINANLPIKRITTSVAEAKEIYKTYNHEDKTAILRFRPEQIVHLYKCDNYYNYLHNYMAPSTGCIKSYKIKPYGHGIILQYPRHELDGEIPHFVEEATYGKTLMKAYHWGMKTKTQTIVDVNEKIETMPRDFVQMCEARHNKQLATLGDNIENDIANIRLICIAGPSSSGKTTFCNRLRVELLSRGIKPVMISMDDYYFTKPEISKIQGKPIGELDLEHINTLDIELFNQNLFDLINGEEVAMPRYNFKTGKREQGEVLKVDSNSPIIIEGIHALNEKLTSSIPKYQKYKIFIAPQIEMNIDNHTPVSATDMRLIRRIVRDKESRNCPAAETINMWKSVRSGEFRWIYPHQEGADFVYNSSLSYELSVFRTIALPALKEIKITDPEYLVANRLIKYLKYFRPLEDLSVIPCNSLIREFIGGSCYKI